MFFFWGGTRLIVEFPDQAAGNNLFTLLDVRPQRPNAGNDHIYHSHASETFFCQFEGGGEGGG